MTDRPEQPAAPAAPSGDGMLAAFLYGARDLRLEPAPRPEPGPGEVLLRVASVGVCGSDLHYYLEGRIGDAAIQDPLIMGHEFSALVDAAAPDVSGLEPGQLVAVEPAVVCGTCELCQLGHPNLCAELKFCGSPDRQGALAEYIAVPAQNCFPLPAGFSADDGALLEPLGIAIHAVDLSHIRPGNSVAVLGAGPIGLLTAAVARAAGASQVILTEPLAYRRSFALDYAADAVLDPGADDLKAAVRDLTGGRGVDLVFEAAGAPETPADAAELVRYGGKILLIGIPSEDRYILPASTARRKGLTVKLVRRMKHTYPRAIQLVASGQVDLRALATHHFSLENLQEALELVADYRDGVIKAVIEVSKQ